MMTPRDKVISALNHESGPIPVDFGSTAVTGIHVMTVEALRDACGLERHPVKVIEPYQMLGLVEEDLIAALGICTAGVPARKNIFGFSSEGWKEWRTPWGQEVLVPDAFRVLEKDDGVYIFPEGDVSVPPSGHMPGTGFFFDTIIRQPELDEANLDPQDNLEEFGPISDEDLTYLKRESALAASTGRAVVAGLPGTAFGDIALVPAPFLKRPKGIRDIAEWYMSTLTRQDYVHRIFERQLEFALANLEKIHAAVGENLDVVFVCGTDFGTQSSTFCSPETYDSLWHPYYKAVNDWIHANTTWKTLKHSCGAVESFMSHFIASGFDIINPVQCSATGMEPTVLKERYGDRLVFWGGGVDTQRTLPFGTPDEVREQTRERCEVFAQNGGFVFNTVHNIQARTPVENLMAMFDTIREFNA
ncbi:MAG: methyltransferase [Candidatus Hydrogenedentes bacterium]|nr:methyltransferase [Candidatus Hydrogenedentota bacterium]